jgi:peptide/nickel transport system substrate-binding protein
MRINYRLFVAFAMVALVGAIVAGCGSTVGGSSSGGGTETGSGGEGGGTFTIATPYPVIQGGWDPAVFYGTETMMMPNLYEGLTRYNPKTGEATPLLAKSFKSSKGGREWTFVLRPAKFHTGRTVTAEAVKEAIERTIKLGQGASYEWEPVQKILTPNPRTVVFQLSKPAPLDKIASSQYGAYIYDVKASGSEDLGKWFEKGNDAGTGPYTVGEFQAGQESELRLDKFPGYWGGWKGNHFESVLYRVVPSGGTTVNLLQAEQVDFAMTLNPQLIAGVEGDPNISVQTTSSLQNIFLMLNTKRAPLDQVGVRQALAYGFNYEDLEEALKETVKKTSGILPPGIPGHVEPGELPEYGFDEGKAKELLATAGYGPGKKPLKLQMTLQSGEPIEEAVVAIAKSSYAPLNVTVESQPLQFATMLAKTQGSESERQDVAVYQWFPDYADPLSWFTNLFGVQHPIGFNATYWTSPKLQQMIAEEGPLSGSDPEKAEALVREMQKYLLEEVPAIPVADQLYQRAMLSSIKGYQENPFYTNAVFAYYLHLAG